VDIKEFGRRWNYGFEERFKRMLMEDAHVEGYWATDLWRDFLEEEQQRIFASYKAFDSAD